MSQNHTPGPWGWFGNQHGIYLASVNRGRQYVMGFERMGMNGAQPTFKVDNRMRPASELVMFEVGDQIARGFKEGKADESVYRLDVSGIDTPDARLIEAAPDLLAACELAKIALTARGDGDEQRNAFIALNEAISKAKASSS